MSPERLPGFASEVHLDEFMSQPSDALVEFASSLSDGLLVLGAGGKMGGTLCRMAKRALDAAGSNVPVFAVSRFSRPETRKQLDPIGVQTIPCDLMNLAELRKLPKVSDVVYMVGRKFGSTDDEPTTWAMNAYLPGLIAETLPSCRLVVFSTGNVYPFTAVSSRGADETTRPDPVGEYAQSCLARERVFEYFSQRQGTETLLIRLNYAVEMRYGVIVDLATSILSRTPIDLSMSHVNVIWQGDACDQVLRAFPYAASPAAALNITGVRAHSVREIAEKLGEHLGVAPAFTGNPQPTALLADSARAAQLLGAPQTDLDEIIQWTAHWLGNGGATLGRPTRFSERTGRF